MSKILVVSDLHLANRVSFGKQLTNPTFKGCNSRFHYIAEAFRWYVQLAIKENCSAMVIPGDLFHERMIMPVPVLNAVYQLLNEAAESLAVFAMTGNHDVVSSKALFGEDGLHSLYAFQGICNVIDKPKPYLLDNFHLSFIPFNISKEKTLADAEKLFKHSKEHKMLSVSFFHHSFEGAMTGPSNWKMPSEIKPSEVPDFDLVISGHLHKHQQLGKVIYVGSIAQHDLGERNYTPGGLIISSDGTWKHVENTISPRFIVLEAASRKDLVGFKPTDYKIIKWKGEEKEGLKIREDVENAVVEINPVEKKVAARTNINTLDTVDEMLKKFVKAKMGLVRKDVLDEGVALYKNGTLNGNSQAKEG